jgi:hypothetical protein
MSDDSQSTTAWNTGALGEERLGQRLNELSADTMRVLHDRRTPGTRANIDHIAVTPTGIYVIDAKKYKGRPSLKVEGGILRPRTEKLLVGTRDQTKLVDGVLKQVDVVRAIRRRRHPPSPGSSASSKRTGRSSAAPSPPAASRSFGPESSTRSSSPRARSPLTSRISTADWRQRCRRHESDVKGPHDLLHSAQNDRPLNTCDLHTLLPPPTGLCAEGVNPNVLIFSKGARRRTQSTCELWIYDFRTIKHSR